ncbi:cohesin domain-containing protein [Pseudoalteromonas sp. DL2-H2.2]|uniref:cohesin domain-containing protein n=1 Tax=Pseudoalteromonas sp. DL2-H2.2 TaxID=2908889 RepID=UPI001F3DC320|nr:cohesin domain-containing protein [Pseudoalteromonas sp. DL2-H2.2]MCF2908522.1 cohesin domain-containing protein [Pseudoalteromonas sp. DL2-H2.2]
MNYMVCIAALLVSLSAFAKQGRIYLETSNPQIKTGSEFYVDVMVENLPKVYGVQLTLSYDAKSVTLIDQDAKAKGTQLEQGDFLNKKHLYTLRNQADLQSGQIQYIASQVAPAQSAAGSGRLARLYFNAPANTSETEVSIQVAEFGTRNGEKYTYAAQAPLSLSFNASYQVQSAPRSSIPLWAFGLAIVLLLSILSAFFIRRRPATTPDSQPA